MSNDLISREALIEALKNYCGKQHYLVSENIWEIIKSRPTAYDVDKVVEQLEKLKTRYMEVAAEHDERGEQYSMDLADVQADAYAKAIEIVKSGGAGR